MGSSPETLWVLNITTNPEQPLADKWYIEGPMDYMGPSKKLAAKDS